MFKLVEEGLSDATCLAEVERQGAAQTSPSSSHWGVWTSDGVSLLSIKRNGPTGLLSSSFFGQRTWHKATWNVTAKLKIGLFFSRCDRNPLRTRKQQMAMWEWANLKLDGPLQGVKNIVEADWQAVSQVVHLSNQSSICLEKSLLLHGLSIN